MSVDLERLEAEIDEINGMLACTYSTLERICNKVKEVILELAAKKAEDPNLVFTYEEVQNIGKKLIHNTIFDYTTRLRRETFNDVIGRLEHKGLIETAFFEVPKQRHRTLYTRLMGIDYQELLLMTAIDRELQSFDMRGLDDDNMDRKEDEILCRVIASSALHGAVIFKGFHEELFKLKFRDIDLKNGFLSIKNNKSVNSTDEKSPETAFFRYFVSPITMVYLLMLMLVYKKDTRTLKTPIRTIRRDSSKDVFGERWRNDGTQSFEVMFRVWTRKIAERNGLDLEVGMERFRQVCIAYLTTKYPIFLLSVHARKPLSDSLDMRSFSPLLNIEFRANKKKVEPVRYADEEAKDYRELLKHDKELVEAIKEVVSLRGKVKSIAKKSRKKRRALANQIRSEIEKITAIERERLGHIPAVLDNYKIYWKWVLSLIESITVAGGSIDTYTGSVGKYFIPLLTEKRIQDMTLEELDSKIVTFLKGYETRESESNVKKFISFIMDECGRDDLKKLYHKKYPNMGISYPKPLLYFDDIDTVLAEVTDRALRLAIILGFYAGLRAGEIERLKLASLIYDGGYVLCVRKSKTRNGIRNIPLHLLMPEKYLQELVEYWRGEIAQRRGDSPFFMRNGKKLNRKKLASSVTRLFKERLDIIIRYHHLRHSFSNWFLIRWFAAFYGKEHFVPDAPFLNNIVFSEDHLQRLQTLLVGYCELQKGQKNFTHVFAALARLVGHGSPKVTIENYIHTVDFLAYLCFRRKYFNYKTSITGKALAKLLNVSYAAMPANFQGRGLKHINVNEIIRAQRCSLGIE